MDMNSESNTIPETDHQTEVFDTVPLTFEIDYYSKNNGGVLEFHSNIYLRNINLGTFNDWNTKGIYYKFKFEQEEDGSMDGFYCYLIYTGNKN